MTMKTPDELIAKYLPLGCFNENFELTKPGLLEMVREIQKDARLAGLKDALSIAQVCTVRTNTIDRIRKLMLEQKS